MGTQTNNSNDDDGCAKKQDESRECDRGSTFRKRRLSIPKIHLETMDAKALEAAADDDSEDDDAKEYKLLKKLEESEKAEHFSPDEKAHTFRKRRLSLTKTASMTAKGLDNDQGNEADSPPVTTAELEKSPVAKRSRRDSDISAASHSKIEHRVTKTVHADELLRSDGLAPPSPAIHSDNVLYTKQPLPPRASFVLDDDDEFEGDERPPGPPPRWSLRRTVSASDAHKLPFPLDVVGTYSCHGVEPVYDQIGVDDAIEEENEEDNDWVSEGGGKPAVVAAAAAAAIAAADDDTTVSTDVADSKTPLTTPLQAGPTTPDRPSMVAKINQDRGGVAYPYAGSRRTALFAVYDGHGQGGELVSQFSLHEVQRRLERHSTFGKDYGKALTDTFLAVDEALRHEPIIEPIYSGTTACVALLVNNVLTLANAGDSRAVMARKLEDNGDQTLEAVDLTIDQNPDEPKEMERILSRGGYVSPSPAPGLSARVWLDPKFTQIGLAMARSIGDHAVDEIGVIAEPVISSYEIGPRDEFMILASDGVWEFLSSSQAVEIVAGNLNRGSTKACQALIEAAAAKWHEEEGEYRDDITAIVVRVQHLWPKKE